MSVAIVDDPTTGTGPHCPLELYAESTFEVPVQAVQGPDGYELENFYADGIRGIAERDKLWAEDDESPQCQCCYSYTTEWQHGSAEDWAKRKEQA